MVKLFIHKSLVALTLSLATTAAWGMSADELFRLAHQQYEKGNYAEASSTYKKILEHGFSSGEIHFALGSAYFRDSKLGLAIFHYRKAYQLLPRDADVKFNLNFARQKTSDKIEQPLSLWDELLVVRFPLNEREAFYVLVAVAVLFFAAGSTYLFKRNDLLRWLRGIFAAAFLVMLTISLGRAFSSSRFGVITATEANVYSGVGRDNVILFTLHEGTEFQVLKTAEGQWVQLLLPDGKKGWVSSLEVVTEF